MFDAAGHAATVHTPLSHGREFSLAGAA